ncbi:hypothetical protein [Pedobacter metabolipauper]|nr:hypothetical protein [Pedobacter metabolipauper]
MKNSILNYFNLPFVIVAGLLLVLSSCAKDSYYRDGGKANPIFDGNMLEFLQSKPKEFDTIAQVIKLAGMEEVFKNEELTFFAPNDKFIRQTIRRLNPELRTLYLDTIKTLADIKPEIWRKYLSRYLFKGKNKLADYSQIDFDLINTFPGQNYFSYNNAVLNIGVIYESANGVKYLGYRRLVINHIPDISKPRDNWQGGTVSSSDIQPSNGVVHTLVWEGRLFGFDYNDFYQDVIFSKR